MKIGIHTSTVQHSTEAGMTLAMYREAFEHHVDKCDCCSWIGMSLCHVGQRLMQAHAEACAALAVSIPTIPRAKVKA